MDAEGSPTWSVPGHTGAMVSVTQALPFITSIALNDF